MKLHLAGILTCSVTLGVVVAGCSKDTEQRACNGGTALLQFSCNQALGEVVGNVSLTGLDDQMATRDFQISCPGSYNLEVQVSGYNAGEEILATVTASAGGTPLLQDERVSVILDPGCTTKVVPLSPARNEDAPVQQTEDALAPASDASADDGAAVDEDAMNLARGQACLRDDQCSEGHCVDGVCCESTCGETCMACAASKTGVTDGTCAFTKTGVAHGACENKAAETCGTSGLCNGAGQCAFWDSEQVCAEARCMGNSFVPAQKCSGAGQCQEASPNQCGDYACTAEGCKKDCTSQTDCVAGVQCVGNKCGGKLAPGEKCTMASDCSTNFCVDDVCCGSACGGTCEACSNAKTGGSNGECLAIPPSKGAQMECATQSAASCGTTGRCDGARKCEFHAAGTDCAGQMCAGGMYTAARKCDGNGTCSTANTTSCAPGTCDASTQQCKATCSMDAQCAAGAYCEGGTCKTKKANAAMCGRKEECTSGHCANGRCCNQACTGACQQCGTGTCQTTTNAEAPGTCAGTKSCSATGVCLLKDGQACSAGSDCLSGTCTTYYRDADNDTYGIDVPEKLCGAGARAGYVTRPGDCCDIDQVSHPFAFVTTTGTLGPDYMAVKNACGSWDWDCNGVASKLNTCIVCKNCDAVSCTSEEEICWLSGLSYWTFVVPECGESAQICFSCTEDGLRDCNNNETQKCR